MADEMATIAVVGAGAIGGVTAARMARAGWNVELVCKHPEIARRAASPGLHITGLQGDGHVPVKAVVGIDDLSGPKDVVFLAVKAADCLQAARDVLPRLRPNGLLVSLQNGIAEDALGQVVGRNRVVGCVVGWGATMVGPGELEITSTGEFVLGNIDHRPDDRLLPLKDMLDDVVPTRISFNIMGELYSKLIVNSCINSLGVIAGLPLGQLLASRKVRNVFIGLMRESMAVADALGIKVEPGGGGKLDYYRFLAGNGLLAHGRRHLIIRLIGRKYRRIRSSSLQSLERGRPTEVDYLNGYVVSRGREKGVPTPLHEAVVSMIKDIEAGRRTLTLANLDHPDFAVAASRRT